MHTGSSAATVILRLVQSSLLTGWCTKVFAMSLYDGQEYTLRNAYMASLELLCTIWKPLLPSTLLLETCIWQLTWDRECSRVLNLLRSSFLITIRYKKGFMWYFPASICIFKGCKVLAQLWENIYWILTQHSFSGKYDLLACWPESKMYYQFQEHWSAFSSYCAVAHLNLGADILYSFQSLWLNPSILHPHEGETKKSFGYMQTQLAPIYFWVTWKHA